MLVSFLVPVYNTEKYLRECIESLICQKGAPFEIVLLDDGSTDSSSMICDQYADRYPDLVRVIHKENQGLLMTRRRGFTEARGDWFICVDSDDYISEKLLETVAQAIESDSALDMIMYNYVYADDQGHLTPSRLDWDSRVFEGKGKRELYKKRLLSTTINSMCMRAVKRDILDFDNDYSKSGIRNMCEDAIQCLPLYTSSKKTIYIDKALYYYRKNSDSITGHITLEHWKAMFRSFCITESYLSKWGVRDKLKEQFYSKQMEEICNCTRWLIRQKEESLPDTYDNVLIRMKEESDFDTCFSFYNKHYASTSYMKMSTPLLAKFIKYNNVLAIKLFLRIETVLRGKK